MYIPIFIAILMGLITTAQNPHQLKAKVFVKFDKPASFSTSSTDSIPPGGGGNEGGDDGINGPGGTGTGGGTGSPPPPKP